MTSPTSAARLRWVRDCSIATAARFAKRPKAPMSSALKEGAPSLSSSSITPMTLLVVEERDAQDALGLIADRLGDVGGLARVAPCIGDRHRLPADGDQPGDAVAQRHAELLHLVRLLPERHLEDQLLLLRVDQKQGRGARGDHVRRCLDDHLEQPRVRDRRGDQAGGRGQGQRLAEAPRRTARPPACAAGGRSRRPAARSSRVPAPAHHPPLDLRDQSCSCLAPLQRTFIL